MTHFGTTLTALMETALPTIYAARTLVIIVCHWSRGLGNVGAGIRLNNPFPVGQIWPQIQLDMHQMAQIIYDFSKMCFDIF